MYIDVRPLIEFKHSIEDMIEDVVYIYEDWLDGNIQEKRKIVKFELMKHVKMYWHSLTNKIIIKYYVFGDVNIKRSIFITIWMR
jgi:hypothetical protein